MARPEDRRQVSDVRALAALAHPLRVALLDHLMALGPRTASECAQALGESPSNCSWHLRHLARFGLVEPDEAASADARERPWRAAATGFDFASRGSEPVARAVEATLLGSQLDEDARLTRGYLAHRDDVTPQWRDAARLSTYGLRLTAAELAELVDALDAAIRPYIGLTRENPPADAQPVHLSLRAFRRPDAS